MHNYLDSQNGPPKFVKRPFKYESLKLTALNSTVGRFHILASNEFQTAGAMELKARALTNMFQIGSWDFQLFLTWEDILYSLYKNIKNDRDLLRATVVTRDGTDTEIRVSTESWPWRRRFSRRSCRDSNPRPFSHESGALTTELSPHLNTI